MELNNLIEAMEKRMKLRDFSDNYLSANRHPTREEIGIGEYAYGITMVPCEWVYPFLLELKNRRIDDNSELLIKKMQSMEQYTIDGGTEKFILVDNEELSHRPLTIKEKFRKIYGNNESVKCGDCKHCIRVNTNNKNYYKCEVMGISRSAATDIRLKDYGCSEYVER